MTIYGYVKKNELSSYVYPSLPRLTIETTDGDIYFVRVDDKTIISKTTDEGATIEEVADRTYVIWNMYYDQVNQYIYCFEGDYGINDKNLKAFYIDLSDDSKNEIWNIAEAGSDVWSPLDVFIINSKVYWAVGYWDNGGSQGYLRIYDNSQTLIDSYAMTFNNSGTDMVFYPAVLTDSDTVYFLIQYSNAAPAQEWLDMFYFTNSVETITLEKAIDHTGRYRAPTFEQVSLGYDGSDIFYFVMGITPFGGDDIYLCSYSLTTEIVTEGTTKMNLNIMPDRNTIGTSLPFTLEKAYYDVNVYQMPKYYTGSFWKIAGFTIVGYSGAIFGITDQYIFIRPLSGGTPAIEIWKFEDMSDYIFGEPFENAIIHPERDYPSATIKYDSNNYYLEQDMFVQIFGNIRVNGSTSVDVQFEGFVIKPEDEDEEAVVVKVVDLVNPSIYDLLKSFSGTLEEGGFDDWLDVLITSFKYITKGTFDAATLTLLKIQRDSEKSNAVFIDQGAVGEEFTWRVRPTGELDWTAGDDDSGLNYDQDTPIWDVEVSKKYNIPNSITVKGGFFGGSQIVSTSDYGQDLDSQLDNGIIEEEFTFAWISDAATANLYADALLNTIGTVYTEVRFKVYDTTNGFVPAGEEITFEYTPKSITSAQYKINQVIYDFKNEIAEYIVSSTVRWDVEDLKGLYENELADQVNQINERTMVKTGWALGTSYSDCTLAFSTPTFTLTLVADDMSYWIDGKKYTFSSNQTVNITDTEGLWYIYFDGDTLTASQTRWSIKAGDKALVAIMYYDADANTATIFWEFHSWETSPADHARDHYSKGTVFSSGFDLTEASELITLTEGSGYDEDILISVTDGAGSGLFEQELSPGQFPVWYRSGATAWRFHAATTLPVYDNAGADNVHYNQFSTPNWLSTASSGANRYVAYWICLVNGIAGQTVTSIMGQTEPALLATAQDLTFADLNLTGLPFEEITQLWKIIYKTNSTFVEATDLRGTNTPGGVYIPPPATNHDSEINIPFHSIGGGTSVSGYTANPMILYPAADNNCYSFWTITIPSWFTAMTNPVLTIRYSASNSDTWGILTSVDASSVGESMTTTTLYNAADNWTTILGANNLDKEEITLSGTISPGDNIGIRLYKNTFDTHILYIHNVFITRA